MSTTKTGQFVVSLEDLLAAGCHFGHQARRWNPKMSKYIWGERNGVHIFDLEKTQAALTDACELARSMTREGKLIVFVGTKRQASAVIEEEAQKAGVPFVSRRWLGGTLTNWKQLKKSIDRLKDLESKRDSGDFDRYTKHERLLIDREINRLTRLIGGLRTLTDAPQALFVVDVKHEIAAVLEARRRGVPVIAIVDTNCDPVLADAVIPANDDATWSVRLISSKISEAIQLGKREREAAPQETT